MKKRILKNTMLFASFALIAGGLGLFRHSFNRVDEAYAASTTIEPKDGFYEVGKYPQTIVQEGSDLFASIEAKNSPLIDSQVYTYQNEKYTYMASTDPYINDGGGKYSDGVKVSKGHRAFFKWEPIKWQEVYTDKDQNVMFLYASQALDVQQWNIEDNLDQTDKYNWKIKGKELKANDWEFSLMRTFLKDIIYELSFSSDEKGYIKKFTSKAEFNTSNKDIDDYITIISTKTFNEYKDNKKFTKGASDWAKAHNLHYHWANYDNCFIWLNTIKYGDRYVDYARNLERNGGDFSESVLSQGMGVRPMIALDLSKINTGGGSGGSTNTDTQGNKSSSSSDVPALVIGIVFSVVGLGGLITVVILIQKGILKAMISFMGVIVVLSCCVAISAAGLISFSVYSGKQVGGSCTLKYGYYVQSPAQYQDSKSNIAQVGYNAWLIKSDGTARHAGAIEDVDNASDFEKYADNLKCTWTKSGCTLTITYSGYYSGVSKFTISGSKLYYNGAEAFHWVRGE